MHRTPSSDSSAWQFCIWFRRSNSARSASSTSHDGGFATRARAAAFFEKSLYAAMTSPTRAPLDTVAASPDRAPGTVAPRAMAPAWACSATSALLSRPLSSM